MIDPEVFNGNDSVFASAIIALSFASAAYAQEALKGEVTAVDEASGKIGIKVSGTVGSSDATAPASFKVQDGLLFNAVKSGDKVSIIVERTGEEIPNNLQKNSLRSLFSRPTVNIPINGGYFRAVNTKLAR